MNKNLKKQHYILADIGLKYFDFLYNYLNLLNIAKLINEKLLCFVIDFA